MHKERVSKMIKSEHGVTVSDGEARSATLFSWKPLGTEMRQAEEKVDGGKEGEAKEEVQKLTSPAKA